MRRNRLIITALALLGVALIAWWVLGMTRNGNQDRLSDDQLNRTEVPESDARCGSQETYDLVKRELFRQAAATRGSDAGAFNSLAAYAAIRVDAPVLKRQDEELGTLVCSGRIALDLPPGVAVVGGRRTLIADADYALQAAADSSGDVVTLSGAEGIILPLATLARTASPQQPEADPAAVEEADSPDALEPDAMIPQAPAPPAVPVPQRPPAPSVETAPSGRAADPSFNCRNARTRGEIAVCNSTALAALDRQMASQYQQAVARADGEQRGLLEETRSRFLRYRDGCRSDDCIADAYRGRMREIRDIEAGRWRGGR